MIRQIEDVLAGRGAMRDSKVPCNGCRECCYHAGVDVYPGREPTAHLDIVQRDGKWYLRKGEDGACVHLGPHGCTIYNQRPLACRAYDCRLYALFNVLDKYDGDHAQPMWSFQPTSLEGRVFEAACKVAGMLAYKKSKDRGVPFSAADIARQVMLDDPTEFERTTAALTALAKLPPDQLAATLGYDPRKTTAKEMSEGMRALFGGDSFVVQEVEE
jgi:hypothetical protein